MPKLAQIQYGLFSHTQGGEGCFQCKTLEKRRYLDFLSEGFHDRKSLVSATLFAKYDRKSPSSNQVEAFYC